MERIAPDLVHGLRIPIEGELAWMVGRRPLIVSIWGNDLTLHAKHSIFHNRITRRVLRDSVAVLADCEADLVRVRGLGVSSATALMNVPGSGGIPAALFREQNGAAVRKRLNIPPEGLVAINPRGFRRYVRNDTYLAAVPLVLRVHPEVVFVSVGLKGWQDVEASVRREGLGSSVFLTGPLQQSELADLFRTSALMVSPTEHDGTPNTLLEAMACGCLPVCGDLPSIREWVEHGQNGFLCDPGNPKDLAAAIIKGIENPDLRRRAALFNRDLVAHRAGYEECMARVEQLYFRLCNRTLPTGGHGLTEAPIRQQDYAV
jgi:glycosyltransferase involved in cell wall biosynthesis